MNVQEDLSTDHHRWIAGLFFCGLLLAPVLADGFFGKHASQHSPWLYAYVVFIGSALLLSLFSVDFQLSASEVRRNIRLLGRRIGSRGLVRRSELKEIRRTTTAVWEHKGALSGTHIDGYIHEIQLVTLDDRCIAFIRFRDVHKNPAELTRVLDESSSLLRLPVVERFHE
ncbi:hypothetical protein [Roseateles depolymerans]|uniref:Uncharacterized protein n=1 Tax=Roseateles depolymerans TaxID=76731 RepID=A0A0U3D249_9BURK|nr:hypothetical protein [Roseateles depolymerans]ALV07670.1 hypothetical protein RD2015_3210 [Roseateles depolymerans]REG22108.1 hypothetical protein DES44_1251 [Roseateles depolymerans]